MPASLRAKLITDAHKYAEARRTPIAKIDPRDPSRRTTTASWFPWVLAAASITIAAFAWVYRPGASTAPTAAQQLTQFEQQPPADLVRIAWAGQPDPLVAEQLTGEVLWSQSQQKGFMKFSGLRANDPTREQYQLWIFDGTREHPVDGGVFDIDADGNAIIPIDAKLTVREPTLFAVTIEKPGGVVVSNKERIAVIAPVDKG